MWLRPRPPSISAPVRSTATLSLRVHLLRALATPLFALVLTSGSLAYWLAGHYTTQVFDRALYGVANSIAQQIRISGPRLQHDIPLIAKTLVEGAGSDRVYWRIHGPDGPIGGHDTWLGYGTGQATLYDARLFYAWYNGRQVRAVRLPVWLDSAEDTRPQHLVGDALDSEENTTALASGKMRGLPGPIVIEVAEQLDRRETAANEILLAVSVPLIMLLVIGGLILSHVLKEELVPLQLLADKLNRQTAKSLASLEESQLPSELTPLIRAMNALLARLREALDAQRKFIADAAHQLRTPLTALKLHADRAAKAGTLQEARPAVLELQKSAERAIRLSNQLLSLARAEPGLTLEQLGGTTPVDVVALAFECGAEWVPQALEKQIDMGFETIGTATLDEASRYRVQGNAVLLREALSNLLDNAIKYVPVGGKVTVRAGYTQTVQAMIMIEDNGPGIPHAQRSQAFTRFFRGDQASAPGSGVAGAGLGLAIVHEIMTLHRGTIVIDDVPAHPGVGMRFVICLPVTVTSAAGKAADSIA